MNEWYDSRVTGWPYKMNQQLFNFDFNLVYYKVIRVDLDSSFVFGFHDEPFVLICPLTFYPSTSPLT